MNLINVGYDSTNYYLLGQSAGRILVDVGWPGTLPKLQANLKRMGASLREIGYLLVTHYHPDHAGLAQELKNQGVRLIVLEEQLASVPLLKGMIKPGVPYLDILLEDAVQLTSVASRAFLRSIGFAGEVIHTPGHSSDSVSLILDDGLAFTGDLPGPLWTGEASLDQVMRSWQSIQTLRTQTAYPGHGPPRLVSTMTGGTRM